MLQIKSGQPANILKIVHEKLRKFPQLGEIDRKDGGEIDAVKTVEVAIEYSQTMHPLVFGRTAVSWLGRG